MVRDSAMTQQSELLDIAQAAAFLHVSQMSLRRWTNSGRLPCFRVGGRRERRFRRADLLAFLERSGEPIRAPQGPGHLCGLYTSMAARERWAAARSGRLVLSQYAPSAAAQLEYWEAGFTSATGAGARELRVAGDVSGGPLGRRRSFDDMLAYEREYGALSRRFGVTTLCLYDARRLSGVEASRVLQVHSDMLAHAGGALVS